MIKFPKDFLWGAATSSYQVEGNNIHCDWWAWEKKVGQPQSGEACRHYELYNHDFDLAKSLYHNAHRLSIEWSRIEPQEGKFSKKELQHYLDVILALKKRKIEPIVTLHHFTNPLWLSHKGGWEKKHAIDHFVRYCEVVVKNLAPHVKYWITINEPTVYLSHAYILGVWPPQAKSYVKSASVGEHLAWAHMKAYVLIHKIYRELNLSQPAVSIAQNVMAFVSCKEDVTNQIATSVRNWVYNRGFFERIKGYFDFIGLNYYSRQVVDVRKISFNNFATDVCQDKHHRLKKNSLGWDIYPQGLYDILLEMKDYALPIMITENGICTSDDHLRWKYIHDHLKNLYRAMAKDVQVIGYLYWSLLDNFEWDKGFAPRFGLLDVNYKTFKRTVRKSAKKFAHVCRTGVLE